MRERGLFVRDLDVIKHLIHSIAPFLGPLVYPAVPRGEFYLFKYHLVDETILCEGITSKRGILVLLPARGSVVGTPYLLSLRGKVASLAHERLRDTPRPQPETYNDVIRQTLREKGITNPPTWLVQKIRNDVLRLKELEKRDDSFSLE